MNKQKKLKLILSSLKEKELIKFFESFLDSIQSKFHKSIKQISFSCYESTCQVDNYMVNGYGKSSSEALISGINNILDCLIEEDEYCEIMRQCLKKLNTSSIGATTVGTGSKKQLLSTEKTVKTLGPETSASLQKKTLTMSASLSSNSKQASSKPKSIKDQIFDYFNLQNLKVKNPNNPFNSITPLGACNKIPKNFDNSQMAHLSQSKEKYSQNHVEPNLNSSPVEFEQIYRRIKQVSDQILLAQKENTRLKQQIQIKNKAPAKPDTYSTNQYFTRPSLQGQQKKVNPSINTQSTKKLSYLEMSLNDKFFNKDQQQTAKIMVKQETNNNENHFEKFEITNAFKLFKLTENNQNLKKSTNSQHHAPEKVSQQRKCLVDISNIKTQADEVKMSCEKVSEYGTFNGQKGKGLQLSKPSNVSTINYQNNERLSTNPILYSKVSQQQESMSIIESSKKLRSFSVQNSLHEKISSYGASHKNPINILSSANNNASFDNGDVSGNSINIPRQKLKIPKLNLEILPNYHGRSNKSLNQSLMEHYQNKNQATLQK